MSGLTLALLIIIYAMCVLLMLGIGQDMLYDTPNSGSLFHRVLYSAPVHISMFVLAPAWIAGIIVFMVVGGIIVFSMMLVEAFVLEPLKRRRRSSHL